MSTIKGNTYLQRLETARCNGGWDAVPEWSRKVLKHAPGRRCLAMAAQTEARIHQLLPPPPPKASPSTIVSYIVSLDALQDALEAELVRSPAAATRLPAPAGGGYSPVATAEDLVDARVVVAWCAMLKGEWGDVVTMLHGAGAEGEWEGGKGREGYAHITRIKALVLQGIALSHTNSKDLSLPLQLYRAATRLAAALPTPQRSSPSFLEWTERALSHSALAAYRCWLENNSPEIPTPPGTTCLVTPRKHEKTRPAWKTDAEQLLPTPVPTPARTPDNMSETMEIGTAIGKTLVDESAVLAAFKAFHSFVSDLPAQALPTLTAPSWGSSPQRDDERREVYRHYFRFLSLLLLPPSHPHFPTPQNLPSGEHTSTTTISIIPRASPTPFSSKAGTKPELTALLATVQTIYEAHLTHSLSFPSAETFHAPIGEFVDLVALNWRSGGATGADAETVAETLYRAATKTFHSPRILRHLFYALTVMGNLTDAVRALETYLALSRAARERIEKGKVEKDFDPVSVVLVTASEGIRMLCKHVGDTEKALDIAGKIESWAVEWKVKDDLVLSAVWRGVGTANAAWARITKRARERDGALQAAEMAFSRGLEHDGGDVDTLYGLALVQADLGDLDAAVDTLGLGISALGAPEDAKPSEEYTRRAVPLLHALALLLSAREEYDAATAACNTALMLLASHAEPAALCIESKETAVQLQMTLMALSEASLGPESAVAGAEALLTLYTRFFPPALKAVVRADTVSTVTTSRPSTASRLSRLFTAKSGKAYEREYSLSAYDLPNEGVVGCLPRPGTAKMSRPGTSTTIGGMTGSQTVRGRGKTFRPAPKIKVSATDPVVDPVLPGVQPQGKKVRRFSVSGGTIRRSKSVKSSASSSTAQGEPTPPVPSTPMTSAGNSGTVSLNVSRDRSPVGSEPNTPSGRDSPGVPGDGVMFSVLKRKLDAHQAVYRNGNFPTPPASRSPVDSIREEGPPKRSDIPNNLPQEKLPYPIAALDERITDGVGRSVKRPVMLPEPVVRVEDERKRAEKALREVWLCVCGLYRRCGWIGDARGALEEAGSVGEGEGEGEADICVEKGLLALETGDRRIAVEFFEGALSVDVEHPGAIVALSQLLLDIAPPAPSPAALPVVQKPKPDRPKLPAQLQTKEENEADFLQRRHRALVLLRSCTGSPRGWDCAEAWYALADALEKDGDIEGAKRALWRVVGIEDTRGVRALAGGVGVRIL